MEHLKIRDAHVEFTGSDDGLSVRVWLTARFPGTGEATVIIDPSHEKAIALKNLLDEMVHEEGWGMKEKQE